MKAIIQNIQLFLLAALLVSGPGCTLQRGVDFGHWARSSEKISPVRFSEPSLPRSTTPVTLLGIVPAIGDMEESYLDQLNSSIISEAGFYLDTQIAPIQRDGKFSQYIKQENLMPIDGVFNSREISRLGMLMGVSHMLCCKVTESRLHPPQILELHFVIVECAAFQTVLEMNARFDAGEQTTLLALDKYLQGRSTRKYNKASLDIMLLSPLEFGRFVSSECMKAIAQKFGQVKKTLKSTPH